MVLDELLALVDHLFLVTISRRIREENPQVFGVFPGFRRLRRLVGCLEIATRCPQILEWRKVRHLREGQARLRHAGMPWKIADEFTERLFRA